MHENSQLFHREKSAAKFCSLGRAHFIHVGSIQENLTEGLFAQSIVKIARIPYRQATQVAFSSVSNHRIILSAKKAFADWSNKRCRQVINQLIKAEIPLHRFALEQVYALLRRYQKELTEQENLSYPARFKAVALLFLHNKKERSLFELEVFSNRKIYMIFPQHEEALIQSASYKNVFKIYSLGYPKKIAYSIDNVALYSPRSIQKAAEREERFLKLVQHQPYMVEVYDIYYSADDVRPQQCIAMKYYHASWFEMINLIMRGKLSLSDQQKIALTCQLLTAIHALHKNKIIHRDIKSENILLSIKYRGHLSSLSEGKEAEKLLFALVQKIAYIKKIALTDFGLSCSFDEPVKGVVGSIPYASPQSFMGEFEQLGPEQDIWSAGCVLWCLWFERLYPWYAYLQPNRHASFTNRKKSLVKQALMMMFEFNCLKPPRQSALYPFWRMLYYDNKKRWSAHKALQHFHALAHYLSQKESCNAFGHQLKKDMSDLYQKCPSDWTIKEKLKELAAG